MQQFKVRPGGFAEIRKKALIVAIPGMIAAAAAAIIISTYNTKGSEAISTLPVVIPVVLGVLTFSVLRSLRRKKAIVDSYTIIIDENLIMRQQLNTPVLTIYFNDIASIVKKKNGCIIVRSRNVRDVIYVLPQMENIEAIEKSLSAVLPVKEDNGHFLQRFAGLLGLLVASLMVIVYISSDKLLVGISGLLLVFFLTGSFLRLLNNKNVDRKSKRRLWVLPIVLASVIIVTILKLTNNFSI